MNDFLSNKQSEPFIIYYLLYMSYFDYNLLLYAIVISNILYIFF